MDIIVDMLFEGHFMWSSLSLPVSPTFPQSPQCYFHDGGYLSNSSIDELLSTTVSYDAFTLTNSELDDESIKKLFPALHSVMLLDFSHNNIKDATEVIRSAPAARIIKLWDNQISSMPDINVLTGRELQLFLAGNPLSLEEINRLQNDVSEMGVGIDLFYTSDQQFQQWFQTTPELTLTNVDPLLLFKHFSPVVDPLPAISLRLLMDEETSINPVVFKPCSNVVSCDFSGSVITTRTVDDVSSLCSNDSIRYLNLSNVSWKLSTPKALLKTCISPYLQSVDLSSHTIYQIETEALNALTSNCPQLRELSLSGLKIDISPGQVDAYFSKLDKLKLWKVTVPHPFRTFLQLLSLTRLQLLWFYPTVRKGPTQGFSLGKGWKGLHYCVDLRVGNLQLCPVSWSNLAQGCPALTKLTFEGPGVDIDPMICPLVSIYITCLSLRNCGLTDSFVSSFSQHYDRFEKLELIDLAENRISADGFKAIVTKPWRSLNILNLAGNNVDLSVPFSLPRSYDSQRKVLILSENTHVSFHFQAYFTIKFK